MISVHSGSLIDALAINGKTYGGSGGTRHNVPLQINEKIIAIRYGKLIHSTMWKNHVCGLVFVTNNEFVNQYHGPYASQGSTCNLIPI